jgi:amino acid transporter
VLYVALQVAFIGAVDPSDLDKGWSGLEFANDFGPLAGIATIIGLSWLATVLYADAVISPAGTGLVYTTVTARISYAMARNRNAPIGLQKTSDRGAPWVSIALAFVVGLIFFLPFPGWQKLVTFITSATVLSFGAGPLVWAALRNRLPDHERPFRVPGGHVIPFLAFLSSNLIIYWAGWTTNWKLFVAILIGFALLGAQALFASERLPRMDWRAGIWILPWLVLIAAVSYLGPYGADAAHTLSPGVGALAMLAISVLVYLLAYHSRLPSDRVRELISEHDSVNTAPS